MTLRRLYASILSTLAIAISVGSIPALSLATPALAAAPACDPNSLTVIGGINCAAPKGSSGLDLFGGNSLFQKIANTLILIIGAVSVIMVIIGGFRYVLSSGNASAVEGAKNTILYAIIGIVVAGMAFAIVNWVAGRFG